MNNVTAVAGVRTKNKEFTDVSRLLIYLTLTFLISFTWFFLANPDGSTWEDMGQMRQSFVALGMLIPVVCHVLTRMITGEGFKFSGEDNSYFGIVLKDKKWIFFLAACLVPWIYTEAGNAISLAIAPSLFDPEYYLEMEVEKRMLLLFPVTAMVNGVVVSFAAFGEEGGWRGYMMPKLMKIMGRGKALIFGGVIWGLWHAPLTCIGHNFGTDYPGFPYVGIVKMCIMCVLMGIILTYITEKSGSVWPAAIMHAVNNSGPSILAGYINPDLAPNTFLGRNAEYMGLITSLLVVVIIVMIKWYQKKGEEK